jgi:hypothetical protein
MMKTGMIRSGWQGERHGEAQAVVHGLVRAGPVGLRKEARQARHQCNAHRHADQAQRQLVEPLRIVEHGAGALVRPREVLRHQRVELYRAASDGAGHRQHHHGPDLRVEPWDARADAYAHFLHPPPQQRRLQRARNGHHGGCDIGGQQSVLDQDRRTNRAQVQQDGRPRCQRKPSQRVQHARQQRGQRHADEVGHGELRHQRRGAKRVRVILVGLQQRRNDPWHRHFQRDDQHHHHNENERRNL